MPSYWPRTNSEGATTPTSIMGLADGAEQEMGAALSLALSTDSEGSVADLEACAAISSLDMNLLSGMSSS